MKIPIIRQMYQAVPVEKLEATLEVLEAFCEARGVSDTELNVAGELITNICGASEVHHLVADGMTESEALNNCAQKVMSSIDR